jgi:hypothetical protein
MQFEVETLKGLHHTIFFANNYVDENTFILLRYNYLEICSMVLKKTNTMHQ